jgi:L-histidine N-alpha-methyltransferase
MAVLRTAPRPRRLTPAPRVVIDVRLDARAKRRALAADVAHGLTSRPKTLPPKYFYDARGSALFDRITETPEYYPTRVETGILRANAARLMERLAPDELVEIGAGMGTKIRTLIDARSARSSLRYVPIDVDGDTMTAAATALTERYAFLDVHGLVGDFEKDLLLVPAPAGRRVVLLLGSTIGNLDPPARRRFLGDVRRILGPEDRFVLGLDLVKDRRVLEAAYDDAAGVTAEFNRNVLHVVNRALGADFAPETYRRRARYDSDAGRIEMHLIPHGPQTVSIRALRLRVSVTPDESIWTESSYKFTRESAQAMLAEAGLGLEEWITDAKERFALTIVAPVRGASPVGGSAATAG